MWTKDGKIYNGGGIVLGDMWYSNPTREQFIAAGWVWKEVPPSPPAPKRYSKLKIVRKLGERWPEYKAGLEANGMWDEFDQSAFLDEDDPVFAAVYATLSDAEKEMLEECLYE